MVCASQFETAKHAYNNTLILFGLQICASEADATTNILGNSTNPTQGRRSARLVGIQIGLKQQELDRLKEEELAITRGLAEQKREFEELKMEREGLNTTTKLARSRARLVGIQIGLKQQELDELREEEQAMA